MKVPYTMRGSPALVAQRIEHLTTDQKVGGSSPSERASSFAGQEPYASTGRLALYCLSGRNLTFSHRSISILLSAARATAMSSGRACVGLSVFEPVDQLEARIFQTCGRP